jgi:hypothetical protein
MATERGTTRVLVVDAMAQSLTWRPGPEVERALHASAPPGWTVRMVQAPTISDGDGPARPSDEALAAIADAEVYMGFGITPPLFHAAPHGRGAG